MSAVLPGSVPMHWDPPPLSRGEWRDWQAELARIAPRSDHLSWLHLQWVPGDPWQPVHRWIVFQMIPRSHIPAFMLPDLQGPNPRWFGHWDTVLQAFVQERSFTIDSLQWTLFRRYGCLARPFWVIQGNQGGHRRRFDHWERVVVEMVTGMKNADPPAPGDLPYAEPDERTIAKLGELDRLRRYKAAIAWGERSPEQVEAADAEQLKEIRAWVWQWLGGQIEGAIAEESEAEWSRTVERMWGRAKPVGADEDPQKKLEQLEERFITEGI